MPNKLKIIVMTTEKKGKVFVNKKICNTKDEREEKVLSLLKNFKSECEKSPTGYVPSSFIPKCVSGYNLSCAIGNTLLVKLGYAERQPTKTNNIRLSNIKYIGGEPMMEDARLIILYYTMLTDEEKAEFDKYNKLSYIDANDLIEIPKYEIIRDDIGKVIAINIEKYGRINYSYGDIESLDNLTQDIIAFKNENITFTKKEFISRVNNFHKEKKSEANFTGKRFICMNILTRIGENSYTILKDQKTLLFDCIVVRKMLLEKYKENKINELTYKNNKYIALTGTTACVFTSTYENELVSNEVTVVKDIIPEINISESVTYDLNDTYTLKELEKNNKTKKNKLDDQIIDVLTQPRRKLQTEINIINDEINKTNELMESTVLEKPTNYTFALIEYANKINSLKDKITKLEAEISEIDKKINLDMEIKHYITFLEGNRDIIYKVNNEHLGMLMKL